MKREDSGAISFDAYVNDESFKTSITQMENRIRGLNNTTEAQARNMDAVFKNLAAGITGYFSIQALTSFERGLIVVRSEFQSLQLSFETMLRSKALADKLMAEAVQLASKTPFTLQEVASGSRQLLVYGTGVKDVTKTLRMLGDVASGVQMPLNDLVYLYGTAQTQGRIYTRDLMQFAGRGIPIYEELAKVVGKSAAEIRDMTEDGKIGMKEIEQVFKNMTSTTGMFYNLMEKQSGTLTGKISNLRDAYSLMLNDLGKSQEGLLYDTIAFSTSLVKNYTDVVDILKVLIATYGVYKTATIVNTLQMEAEAAGSLAKALRGTAIAQGLLNVAQKANPIGLVFGAVTALIGAYTLWNKKQSETKDLMQSINAETAGEITRLNATFEALKKAGEGSKQRAAALKEVNERYGDYLQNLLTESSTLTQIEAAQKRATNALLAFIAVRQSQGKLESLLAGINDKFNKKLDDYQAIIASSFGPGRLAEFITQMNSAVDAEINSRGGKVERGVLEYSKYAKGVYDEFINAISKKTGYLKYDFADFQDMFLDFAEYKADKLPLLTQVQGMISAYSDVVKLYTKVPDAAGGGGGAGAGDGEGDAKKKIDKEIAMKKDAYERYFMWVTAFGKKAADDQFQALLAEGVNYGEYLKKQILSLDKTKEKLSKEELIRLSALKDAFAELGRAFNTPANFTAMPTGASYEQATDALKKYLSERQAKVIQSKKKELDLEKHTYDQMVLMGHKELQAYMDNIKKKVQGLKLTADEYKKLIKLYDDAEKALKVVDTVQGLKDASELMGSLGELTSQFDEELGKTIRSAAELANNLSAAVEGFASKNPVQGMVGIIGTISSIAQIASDLMDDSAVQEEYRQAQLEQSNKVIEAMNDLLNQQIGLIDDAYGTDKIEAFKKALKQAANDQEYYNRKLNSIDLQKAGTNPAHPGYGAVSGDMLNRYLGFNGGDMAKALEQLKYDIQTGIVNGTEQNEELALNYIEQLQNNADQMAQLQQQYYEYVSGTSVSNLVDDITEMFEQGKTSAQDFADTFEDIMGKALLQTFKIKMLEGPLTAWFEEYSKGMASGAYNQMYFMIGMQEQLAGIGEDAQKMWDEFMKNYPQYMEGLGLTPSGSESSLTGAIKGVTEETASLIAGQMNAIRMNQAEMLGQTTLSIMHLANIDRNTYRLFNIEKILKEMNGHTRKISSGASNNDSTGTLI